MNSMLRLYLVLFAILLLNTVGSAAPKELPADLKWETNTSYKSLGSPDAKKGGTLYSWTTSFPLTFRYVGPDSNGEFAHYLRGNSLSLLHLHPDTDEIVPVLATHWAPDADGKTMYFKLNSAATWSDGKPVVADDYLYTMEFMLSKEIVDPWYNDYYKREIEAVQKFKDKDGTDVIAVSLTKKKPMLFYYANFSPFPRHFYQGKLNKDFVKATNWMWPPVTGPYVLDSFDKGKSLTFKRVSTWWAKEHPFFKGRFNVDKVVYKVIRDLNTAYRYFEKGELDMFGATTPQVWYEMAVGPLFDNGYVQKVKIYNDVRHSDGGYWLNQDFELFKDKNVRLAIHHALNIDKVIKQVYRGDFERLDGVTQGFGKYTNPAIKARTYDVAKAEEYLKKAGWVTRGPDGIFVKDGKRLEATVTYDNEIQGKALVVLREEAKKAGFDLKLQQMDSAARFQSFREKKHQIALSGWAPQFMPEYAQHFHSEDAHRAQTNNITNTDNKELDKVIDAFRNTAELEEDRVKLAHQIQQMVHDEGMFIPSIKPVFFRYLLWPWIKLPKPMASRRSDSLIWWLDSDTSDGGQFWIDEEAKKEVKEAMKAKRKLPVVSLVDETYKKK